MPIEHHNRLHSTDTHYCCITLEKWYKVRSAHLQDICSNDNCQLALTKTIAAS
jgi:hypothetical protein